MKWLNRLNLSHKLLIMLLLPLLVLLYFAISQTGTAIALRSSTAQLTELASLSAEVSALVHELQKERGATAGFLGSKGVKFGPELTKQRAETDAKAGALKAFLESFDPAVYGDPLAADLADALRQLGDIGNKRAAADQLTLAIGDALGYYTRMNARFLGLVSEMSKISPNKHLSIMTAAYANFLQSKERAGIERAVLSNTFAQDRFGPGLYRRYLDLVTTQNVYMNVFESLADAGDIRFLEDTLKGEFVDETTRMRKVAEEHAVEGGFATDGVYWFKMQTGKINLLKQVEDHLANNLMTAALRVRSEAASELALVASISTLGVLLALVVGWVLARNIYRQLGGEPSYIAAIADQIAHGDLDTALRQGRGKATGIYSSIVAMRDNLKKRIREERKMAAETLRIKTALDHASSPLTVSDDGNKLIYMNVSARNLLSDIEPAVRRTNVDFAVDDLLGRSIGAYFSEADVRAAYSDELHDGRTVATEFGGRSLSLTISPVHLPDGAYLGRITEWRDRTEELARRAEDEERIAQERVQAAENARIRTALDNVSSNVMMADTDGKIIYVNKNATRLFVNAEKDFRRHMPRLDAKRLIGAGVDDLHVFPANQPNLLANLRDTYESELGVGGHTLRIVANPVFDDGGQRLGTAIEWADRSNEVAVEAEIDGIVEAAKDGDLERRIGLDGKHGFFRKLGQGINSLIDVLDSAFGDIAGAMHALSEGDLTHTIRTEYQGRFGEVKQSINQTSSNLQKTIGQLRAAAGQIASASEEISAGNDNLSQRTEQQASSLEETAASMEQLTSTVRNNADNSQQANTIAGNARRLAEQGGEVVSEAVVAMDAINASSAKIAEIIGVIDEIAFQTNLLALNASVEAARAGEQGRGFAVVATEVRNLASRSAGAAKEIKDLIQDSVGKVKNGSQLVHRSGQTLAEIVDGVKKVGDIVAEIAAASAEQSAGIDQVNRAVTSMDEVTQQNAALAEQASAASTSMLDKAREIQDKMSFFKVDGGSGMPASRRASVGNVAAPSPTVKPAAAVTRAPAPSKRVPSEPAANPAPATKASLPAAAAADDGEWEEF